MNAETANSNLTTGKVRMRRFLGSILVLLFIGVIWFALRSSRAQQPQYGGKTLGQWLVEVDYNQPVSTRAAAKEAIQKMGINALPFLIKRFQDSGSSLPYYMNRVLAKIPMLKFRFETANERVRRATWGFDALGPVAKPAIPDLQRLLLKCPGYVPDALAGIGPDAVPALTQCLTNETLFYIPGNTIGAIYNAINREKIPASYAEVFLPDVRRWAASTNSHAARYATDFLRQFSPASLRGVSDKP